MLRKLKAKQVNFEPATNKVQNKAGLKTKTKLKAGNNSSFWQKLQDLYN